MEEHDKDVYSVIDRNIDRSDPKVGEHKVNNSGGNETHLKEISYTKHMKSKPLPAKQHMCSPNFRKLMKNENEITIYSRINADEDNVQVHSMELGQFSNTDEYVFNLCDDEQSMLVSEVLSDIGITAELVEARRNTWLEIESMNTVHWRLQGANVTWYNFGSKSEGATTFGLDSDVDFLIAENVYRIIHDINEWKQIFDINEWKYNEWKYNLLVHKLEDTSPGYCKLLAMRIGEPILMTEVKDNKMFERGEDGKVYLKCEFLKFHAYVNSVEKVNGPAWRRKSTKRGIDEDYLNAYYCRHLPQEAMDWIHRTKDKPWPKEDLRKRVIESGYFIVAVGHKQSKDLRTEFRMSTTLGERILMFDMNISQIQCLVLMKMLIKTIVNKQYKDAIKSFYCKTALSFVTENDGKEMFRPDNILECVRKCFQWIYQCLQNGYNPHYMIYSLDMFEGRLDATLREKIGECIKNIMNNPILAIMKIQFDEFGRSLYNRISNSDNYVFDTKEIIRSKTVNFLSRAYVLWGHVEPSLFQYPLWNIDLESQTESIKANLSRCELLHEQGDIFMQKATRRYTYMLQANLGMLMAAESIQKNCKLSDSVLQSLKEGTFADAVSGRLKYATILVCLGDLTGASALLKEVEIAYNDFAMGSVCNCTNDVGYVPKTGFGDKALALLNTGALFEHFCHCVVFVETLKPCVPSGWLDTVFRPIEQPSDMDDEMEFVRLDPKPYFHFVEMMLHKELNNRSKAMTALLKLEKCVSEEQLFHKDTGLILLSHSLKINGQLEKAKIIYAEVCCLRKSNTRYKSSHVRYKS